MIWLNPANVAFGDETLANVESVAVDRAASRLIVDHTDGGPHAVFADAPEQRVTVRVVRRLVAPETPEPTPGEMGTLVFDASSNASSASVQRVTIGNAMVTSVTHTITRTGGARQNIDFVAVSSDGIVDPVQRSAPEGGA